MGQAISAIRNSSRDEETQQRLRILEKMLDQRLETKERHILNGEKNDQEIDTGTIQARI